MDYTGIIPDVFDLYIFDLDGTLVDSLPDLTFAVNEILAQYEFHSLTQEEVRRGVGTGSRNLLFNSFKISAQLEDTATNSLVEKALPQYLEFYEANSTRSTAMYPGIRLWLEELSAQGKKMAVLTNKGDNATKKIIRFLKADQFFSIIAGPEYAGSLKPENSGILRIIKDCGAIQSRTVMIGDSMVDFGAARNAGVAICGISGGLGNEEELRNAGCDFFIERHAIPAEI